MNYSVEIIRKNQQSTSYWAGGITTQLAIFPKDASYHEQNFKWRLSSAQVVVDESTFTHLPGIWRHIMIIDGTMKLVHEGHYSVSLKPFEQDSFSGDWKTQSFGKARDFNLMLAQDYKGKIMPIFIERKEPFTILKIHPVHDNKFPKTTEAFYCIKGSICIWIDTQKVILHEEDILLINFYDKKEELHMKISNQAEEKSCVIQASIFYR